MKTKRNISTKVRLLFALLRYDASTRSLKDIVWVKDYLVKQLKLTSSTTNIPVP